jgi:hypothetical protein
VLQRVSVRRRTRVVGTIVSALLCAGVEARAQDAATDAATDAVADAATTAPIAPDPRTTRVRALIADALPPDVDAQSLFDVSLRDEPALEVEALRVRALLGALDAAPDAGLDACGAPRARVPQRDASPDADELSVREAIAALDPAPWIPRVELDRARLAFYALPAARRAELLRRHAERVEAARPRETEQQRLAREAAAERVAALEAARRARSEAERLVGEEVVRLIGVQQALIAARGRFQSRREALSTQRDAIIGWQRRARDARGGAAGDADALYDAIRQTLRASRDALDDALNHLDPQVTELPPLGPNPLTGLPVEVSTAEASARRRSVSQQLQDARAEERALRETRASALFDACTALNRERLALLPYLSRAKRGAITGFTTQGVDQARAEARQLSLILRYHRHIGTNWVRSVRRSGRVEGASVWTLLAVVVPLTLVLFAFFWTRRHSAGLLAELDARMAAGDRAERRATPSPTRTAVRLLIGVHRPLERLLFFLVTLSLLPDGMLALLEVQLLTTIVAWALAGSLVVNAINTFTAGASGREHDGRDQLRLRSLQLVGRVVVFFALALVLSARLVGKGTVYQWALAMGWVAALAVFLRLVSWWRSTVFARFERVRRKTATQRWVLEHRVGWQSFVAASVAAVQLFGSGTLRVARSWLGDFELVRRGHAYLFKRELDRLVDGDPKVRRPLSPAPYASLSPDRVGAAWAACPADEHREVLAARVARRAGGVVAVVGRQGMGKSAMLARLAGGVGDARTVACDDATEVDAIAASIAADPGEPPRALVILDDAQALVKPVFGGLKTFDETLALARANSDETLWIFAIDAIVWPFLRRARDARPLFDEVIALDDWTDAQIGALISSRSREAGLDPVFDDLLDRMAPSADEIDRQEALSEKREGYFRMVWDYARGNPAVALEAWRTSLVEDEDGIARVRPLQTPDVASLEALPDTALFVLRAVMQMSPATARAVSEATHLPADQIENVFRFGRARGYLREDHGRLVVPWAWRRPVILLLERRHLLVNP